MTEAKLQTKVLNYLKDDLGCWAMKVKPGGGVPTATADIFFCKGKFYGWIEVKRSAKAKIRLGQKPFIDKMNDWSWAKFVYPENWEVVKSELDSLLKN